MIIEGKDLQVGDTIKVWWGSNADTIIALEQYRGPLECLKGAQLATFALNRGGMTIEADHNFTVLNRWAR